MSEKSGSQTTKKVRGQNFSTDEKNVLLQLIEKYKSIVENKKTDAVTTATKNEGWQKLTLEFNSMSSFCIRTSDQLKSCWDNMKRNARKDKADLKKEIFLTGGGITKLPPPQPLNARIEDLLGPTAEGLQNPFDSDSNFNMQVVEETQDIAIDITNPHSTTSWNVWTPAALQQPINENLRVPVRNAVSEILTTSQVIETPPHDNENPQLESNNLPQRQIIPQTPRTHTVTAPSQPSARTWSQRRRPKASLSDQLIKSKIELVNLLKVHAENEAKKKRALIDGQILIVEEQLKQEKLKTQLLELELKKST